LWVSEARSELSDFFEICLPDDDIVNLLMDKQRFHEMCVSEGWPEPSLWILKDRKELDSALEEVIHPCILKPATKNSSFRKNAPRKAFKIFSPDELLRTYDLVSQWESEIIIQEWVQGGDERIAFCLAYYNQGL